MTKTIFMALIALPLTVSGVSAAERLSDARLDTVTAGLALPGIDCPGCALAGSSSMSTNGVTTSSSSSTTTGGGGSSGDGSSGGGGGATGPSVQSAVQVPANLAAIVGAANTITITH